MSGVGLEVLLEGLIPEIAYAGEKGEFVILHSTSSILHHDHLQFFIMTIFAQCQFCD